MDRKPRVLVVDDEESVRNACEKILSMHGFDISNSRNAVEAMKKMDDENPDIVLLDVMLPDHSGLEVLSDIKSRYPDVEVIVMTAFGSIDMAIDAIKKGAYDFLTKPFPDLESLPHSINKAFEKKILVERARKLEGELFDRYSFSNLIGTSRPMKDVYSIVRDVAYSSSTILIQGESGTGKELVAKAIHYNSARKDKDIVAFNCSALTGTLIDSELFGHVRGAFTGAFSDKKGLFEAANQGTIFLDEVGDMPPETQVRLLRVIEEGEVKAVGSASSKKVSVRIIAATNKNLKTLIEQGKFREDLFYRLSVIVIELPPLRERRDDIPVLAYYFLRKYNEKNSKNIKHISADVIRLLESYSWPGNVRELENVIERGVVVAKGDAINLRDLPAALLPGRSIVVSDKNGSNSALGKCTFKDAKKIAMDSFANDYFSQILNEAKGNVSKASEKAGLDRSNLKKLLDRYGINSQQFKD